MKGICYILFGIVAFLFLPCVVVGQNVGEWQEPFDSSVAGKSLRQGEIIPYDTTNTYNMHIRLYFNGKEKDFSNFEIMFFVKDSISHKYIIINQ